MIGTDGTHRPLALGCLAVGGIAVWIASDYAFGTVRAMGPGFVPCVVGVLLMLFGLLILAMRGRDVPAVDEAGEDADAYAIARIMGCVIGAIAVFGLGIRTLGLALTTFLVVAIAGFAQRDVRLVPLLALAAFLSAGASLVFVLLLGLQISIAPRFE